MAQSDPHTVHQSRREFTRPQPFVFPMNDGVKSSWVLNFENHVHHSVLGLQLTNNVIFISVSTWVKRQHQDV